MKPLLLMALSLLLAACASSSTAEQQLQGQWLNEDKLQGLNFEGNQVSEIKNGEVQKVSRFHVETDEEGTETLVISDKEQKRRIRLQRDINRLVLKARRDLTLRRVRHRK